MRRWEKSHSALWIEEAGGFGRKIQGPRHKNRCIVKPEYSISSREIRMCKIKRNKWMTQCRWVSQYDKLQGGLWVKKQDKFIGNENKEQKICKAPNKIVATKKKEQKLAERWAKSSVLCWRNRQVYIWRHQWSRAALQRWPDYLILTDLNCCCCLELADAGRCRSNNAFNAFLARASLLWLMKQEITLVENLHFIKKNSL